MPELVGSGTPGDDNALGLGVAPRGRALGSSKDAPNDRLRHFLFQKGTAAAAGGEQAVQGVVGVGSHEGLSFALALAGPCEEPCAMRKEHAVRFRDLACDGIF